MLILPVGFDQVEKGLAGQLAGLDGVLQPHEHGMARSSREGEVELALDLVEEGERLGNPLVADVVGQPREAVQRHEVLALGARQQARGDGEVLGPGQLGQAALVGVGPQRATGRAIRGRAVASDELHLPHPTSRTCLYAATDRSVILSMRSDRACQAFGSKRARSR